MNFAATTRRPARVPLLAIAGGAVLAVSAASAQPPAVVPQQAEMPLAVNEPVLGSAGVPRGPDAAALPLRANAATAGQDGSSRAQPSASGHPLLPVLRWAAQELPALEGLQDYAADLVLRERVDGRLGGYEHLTIKIRHKPFSVYANFLAPAAVKGQEVVYVEGRNGDNMSAHRGRSSASIFLRPDGPMAMQGRLYPLTEIGMLNMVHRLVEVGEHDVQFGECEVKYFPGAKVNQRVCTMIQVVHPQPRAAFRFHLARLFIDDELKLPIRFESHFWPREPGGPPVLSEEYTYLDLKLNNGFTDEDFSTKNPRYRFR